MTGCRRCASTSSVTACGRGACRSCATTGSPISGLTRRGLGTWRPTWGGESRARRGQGGIASGELPGGPVVTAVYTGVPEGLGAAYARIGAWLQEHGEEPE